jgi:hypothetical protein
MPTATQTKTFNYDLLRKRVRLFDSNSDGERNLAVTQALRQCAEQQPPVLFYEAVCGAFGGGNNAELEKLRADLEREKLRANAELEKLRDEFEELKAVASALNDENQRLMEEVETLGQTISKTAWPSTWILQPKPLLVILGLCVAVEWLAGPLVRGSSGVAMPFFITECLHMVSVAMFVLWSIAQYKSGDLEDLGWHWSIWIGGWLPFVLWHLAHAHNATSSGIDIWLIPLYYWNCIRPDLGNGDIAFALSLLFLVVDVNIGLPVVRWTLATLRNVIAKLLELIA